MYVYIVSDGEEYRCMCVVMVALCMQVCDDAIYVYVCCDHVCIDHGDGRNEVGKTFRQRKIGMVYVYGDKDGGGDACVRVV